MGRANSDGWGSSIIIEPNRFSYYDGGGRGGFNRFSYRGRFSNDGG